MAEMIQRSGYTMYHSTWSELAVNLQWT